MTKTCRLVLAGTLAVLSSWQTASAQQTAREQFAAEMLNRLGGAHLARDRQTGRVTSLGLVNVWPTNEALSLATQLPGLSELEVVALPGQDFDDRGMAYLRGLTQLQFLQLVGPRVTDRGIASLAGLTNLEQLSINAPIADAGLQSLQGLTQLRLLDLYGTRITGEGLRHLTSLTQLEFLCLDRSRVGDAGLQSLADLNAVRTLLLRGTRVTDAGLATLASLPNLERLHLDGTAITENGLAALTSGLDPQLGAFTGPTQLRELSLRGAPNLRGDHLAGVANLYGLPFFRELDVTDTPLAADAAKMAKLNQASQTVEHWRSLPTVRSEGPIARFDDDLNLFGLYFIGPTFAVSREALNELSLYPPTTLQELSLREATLRRADTREPGDLQRLSKLTSLQRLNLYRTGIADADLQQLQPLTNLRELYLSEGDTLVTAEGEQALKSAIPGLQIIRLP
jgi:hypothetical protein